MANHRSLSTGQGHLVKLAPSLVPIGDVQAAMGNRPTWHEYKTWILTGPAVWYDKDLGYITVPKGFMTDFASIPWVFRWWQTGSVGPQRIASYFHDYMYAEQVVSRKESDRVFREVMKATRPRGGRIRDASSWMKRNIMWGALRVVGCFAWRSNGRNLAEEGSGWRVADPNDGPSNL
jgi:hypothetical protein